jgi:hypothetical protein
MAGAMHHDAKRRREASPMHFDLIDMVHLEHEKGAVWRERVALRDLLLCIC